MGVAERLTIDTNVARDFLEPLHKGHRRTLALFELARTGDVQIAAAASGYIFDLSADPAGELAVRIRAMLEAENITETTQLSYPGVMYSGKGAYPGVGVEGFRASWDGLLADMRAEGRVKRVPQI
jgi:hypothetical protein